MDVTLKLVGFGMSVYGLTSFFSHKVWAKNGMKGEYIFKYEKPKTFFMMCLIYIFVGQLIFWGMIYYFNY